MEKLKELYRELYEAANIAGGYRLNKTTVYFDELSHFVGMKGTHYDQQKTKLLIVGRAVNGWGQLDTTSSAAFSKNALEKINEDHFNWIVCDHGTLRNNQMDKENYYWLKDSPFWRAGRKIWMQISGKSDFEDSKEDRWVDYIAWTNLYKIAPHNTGNPTTTMSKKQLTACKNILKAEIELFKPTHILFITGYEWWLENFRDILGVEFADIKKNEYRSGRKNNYFVEASSITQDNVPIVVACRPEYRDEKLYVEDVCHSFESLKK